MRRRSDDRVLRISRSRRRAAVLAAVAAAAIAAIAAAGSGGERRFEARAATTASRILFGLGPEADGARQSKLAASAPLGMLTSWYNGPGDLSWLSGWRDTEIRRDYAAGYVMHLIVYSGGPHTTVSTVYGPACGQAYPLSAQFLGDMERLARIFSAPAGHQLYVTLFSEFQTYACRGNEWSAEPQTTAYLRALKDQYRRALAIFHSLAPGSAVSLGWGGWQDRWKNSATGGGRALFGHFADVMKLSDFESFEVLGSQQAVSDISGMTAKLRRYGPVMLAYYKPPGSGSEARGQLRQVLSEGNLRSLMRARLFALSFMDESFLTEPESLAIATEAIKRYGCQRCGPGT